MKRLFERIKHFGYAGFEIAFVVFLLTILLNAWKANEPHVSSASVGHNTLLSQGGTQCVTPPSNMVSWWPAEGDATDIQDGNNGTLVGGTMFAVGQVGQAFLFDGVDDEVQIPNNANLEPQTLTIDFWFNSANPGEFAYLLSKGAQGCLFGSYSFNRVGTGGGLAFDVTLNGGLIRTPFSSPTVFNGQWHHAAGTYDGNNVCLYIDGVQVGCTSVAATITYNLSTTNDLFFGTYPNTGCGVNFHYNGLLDEVEIFNRALTQAEIQSIFDAGSFGKCKGCTNDTTPPSITCPSNVSTTIAASCPPAASGTVTFDPPTASDNCPGVTTVCTPPSGSMFPVGITTVTCTATDASGNTATCSFTVTLFNGCLQDEANPGNVVLFNTFTGEYIFCCNGVVIKSGTGVVDRRACNFTITHNTTDRRVLIRGSFTTKEGAASVQMPPGQIKCTITDKNITNNTCQCPAVVNGT